MDCELKDEGKMKKIVTEIHKMSVIRRNVLKSLMRISINSTFKVIEQRGLRYGRPNMIRHYANTD